MARHESTMRSALFAEDPGVALEDADVLLGPTESGLDLAKFLEVPA
jgi:hypothetical protein